MSCCQQEVQSVELGYVIICKKWLVAVVVVVTDLLSMWRRGRGVFR